MIWINQLEKEYLTIGRNESKYISVIDWCD
jgi:hypothetical protein